MSLFYAMKNRNDTDEYKSFIKNFKSAVDDMSEDEKHLVFDSYGDILKYLMNVYRKSDEVIKLIDETINFIDDDEFVTNLKLYKMAALNHLGKTNEFNRMTEECQPAMETAFESGKNFELYFIYNNNRAVSLQDTFDYAESLRIGNSRVRKIQKLLNKKDPNFSTYADQYFKICCTLALTCYFTLNNSNENLELARKFSDVAIEGFTRIDDKMRQYQIRAQIEAEVDNFDFACEMLNKGLNISYKNPQAEDLKNFSMWQWYHFAKFLERLLNSSYFETAKHAVEISRAEFLNYRSECGDTPRHPDYITFSKIATCFDIVGDKELALQLNEAALRGVNEDSGDDTAAFRLVMTADELLTLERNNLKDKAENQREELKNKLDKYLNPSDKRNNESAVFRLAGVTQPT